MVRSTGFATTQSSSPKRFVATDDNGKVARRAHFDAARFAYADD